MQSILMDFIPHIIYIMRINFLRSDDTNIKVMKAILHRRALLSVTE